MQKSNSCLMQVVCLAGILGVFTACSATKPGKQLTAHTAHCYLTDTYPYDPAYVPEANVQAVLRADTALTRRFAVRDLATANAIIALPLLRELVALETANDDAGQQKIINKRHQILDRVLLTSTQLAGVAAELDCESREADRLADYLDDYNSKRVRRLTLLSVVIGAVTTIGTTLMPDGSLYKIVGVSGGVAGAGFGGLAAFSSDRTVRLDHPRNVLTDIWNQSQYAPVYPPLVWYALNEKLFSEDSRYSMIQQIRQRWQNSILNGSSPASEALYFGPGGNYKASDLHTRASMLNDLQSSVRSINQDLHKLTLALVRSR